MTQPHPREDVLFSIVVATYNGARTLRCAIDSVLEQSCRAVEVVVVDGGSTDDTVALLGSYRDDPRLRWISEADAGIYDAMNKGVLLARGRYVLFLGADDRLHARDVLEQLAGRIAPDSDVIVGSIVYASGKVFNSRVSPLLYLLNTIHHQATVYRRQVLLDNPFNPSRKVCGDYELNLLLYRNRCRIQETGLRICTCGDQGVTKQVLWPGSREEIDIKRALFGNALYPFNFLFVLTKFLVRKLLRKKPPA